MPAHRKLLALETFEMSKAASSAKLAEVKLALAHKCERLAKVAKSVTKQKTWVYHAAKFRRQAADLAQQ
jgi:hypothetical protein